MVADKLVAMQEEAESFNSRLCKMFHEDELSDLAVDETLCSNI